MTTRFIDFEALSTEEGVRLGTKIFLTKQGLEFIDKGEVELSMEANLDELAEELVAIIEQEGKYFQNGFIKKTRREQQSYVKGIENELKNTINNYLVGNHAKDTITNYIFKVRNLSKPYIREK